MRPHKPPVIGILLCALVTVLAVPAHAGTNHAGTNYVSNTYASTAYTYPSDIHRTCDLEVDGMRAGGYIYNHDTGYSSYVYDSNGADNGCAEKFSYTLSVPGDSVYFEAWRQNGASGTAVNRVSAVQRIS